MATSLPSDEVAEDYKGALEDLVTNDRYSIANLTMIAKENIEHAEAISRVLINHINRAPPTRKLPALYVLDSLAKNIGSPYTIYFARSLHQTYMLAYSQVDAGVRRKLEEMLRTWREPVPGSLSTTPVFPLSSTQTIVDALNKYRANTASPAIRHQQPVASGLRSHIQQPYRSTPTPPQQAPTYPHHNSSTPQPSTSQHQTLPIQSQGHGYSASGTPQYQNSVNRPSLNSNIDLSRLHGDIDDLTTDAKIACATHPMDANAQRKLITLQTLKELLDSGPASEQDLLDIKSTIDQEMAKKRATQQQTNNQHIQSQTAYMPPQAQSQSQPQPQTQTQHQVPATSAIPSFLNSTNLAELLRATANTKLTPQPPTTYSNLYGATQQQSYSTPPPIFNVATPVPEPAVAAPPQIPAAALPLLEQLRASGLLSATPTPSQGITPPQPFSGLFTGGLHLDVQLTTASIKLSRPHLVTSFLNDKPNQCSTCGRRFTSDDIGKEKKSRHLDWHFKTKARIIEAEERGQNRSWYVDEREWIVNKEFDDDALGDEGSSALNGASTSTEARKKDQDFVRAPTDPFLRNAPCPIDQEPFKSEWSEEVQDFIWKDAIHVGNRYYHASCYREATKDRDKDGTQAAGGTATARTATPDSVLGKRKAEDNDSGGKSRVKLEA